MKPAEWWKNFRLGEELSVCGTFIYNGLRRFHTLHKLDHADDLFEVFYQLSVGIERLMKIAVLLLEHDEGRGRIRSSSARPISRRKTCSGKNC